MIIVDYLIKYTLFCSIWKIDSVSVNHTWFTEYYHKNNVSDFIISDQNSQFINVFWKQICLQLRINIQLFTVFHSQTDDQTECINQFIKLYLCEWRDWLQTDWAWWVINTEFAYNNSFHFIISCILFMIVKDFHLHISTEILYELKSELTFSQKWADAFVNKMKKCEGSMQQHDEVAV